MRGEDTGIGEELVIDITADGDEPAEHPTKTLAFVSTFDPSARVEVIPTRGQTVREAAGVSGLTARDGSAWTVYDDLGVEVAHLPSFDMIGDVLYVGPAAISAGSPTEAGITLEIDPYAVITSDITLSVEEMA